jgi:hypothetical protein
VSVVADLSSYVVDLNFDTFFRCAASTDKLLSGDKIGRAIQMVDKLENVVDAGEIVRLAE